jgi:diaminopimelate epimerase
MIGLPVVKAHALGNDFLLVDARDVAEIADLPALARAMCERHRGLGADGLIVFGSGSPDRPAASGEPFDSREQALAQDRPFDSREQALAQDRPFDSREQALAQDRRPAVSGQRPAVSGQRPAVSGQRPAVSGQRPTVTRMHLLNADGSYSEVSGNGVRCLAAWLVACGEADDTVDVETDAGTKRLTLVAHEHGRAVFRAAMGQPEQVARVRLEVGGRPVEAITLRVGNPQCVVLGEVSDERLRTVAASLAVHPHFPEGTNVELASVEAPDRVNILIWERGVGPTEASGTGACAAAVAAMTAGGAGRDVQVVSPGGTQRVEWNDEGLFLTGWAEVVAEATWLR